MVADANIKIINAANDSTVLMAKSDSMGAINASFDYKYWSNGIDTLVNVNILSIEIDKAGYNQKKFKVGVIPLIDLGEIKLDKIPYNVDFKINLYTFAGEVVNNLDSIKMIMAGWQL